MPVPDLSGTGILLSNGHQNDVHCGICSTGAKLAVISYHLACLQGRACQRRAAVKRNGASDDLANAASENAAKDATDTLRNLWDTPFPTLL
jgi:hypothetical protein